MGVLFVAESQYWTLGPANPQKISDLALALMEKGVVFVAEHDGRVVGMVAGHLYVHPMLDATIATETAWWVEADHRGVAGRKLLKRFEQWGAESGASHINMVAPTDRVGKHYEALGYHRLEDNYVRRV